MIPSPMVFRPSWVGPHRFVLTQRQDSGEIPVTQAGVTPLPKASPGGRLTVPQDTHRIAKDFTARFVPLLTAGLSTLQSRVVKQEIAWLI
jgi:hypothetical protein